MLSAGLISALIGTELPGQGSIYVSQTLNFKKPVYIGDRVTAYVEVYGLDVKKNKVTLNTWCENQHKEVVVEGGAVVKLPG
jgi:3-hydroxybutyryl-CoA dehydratase